MSLKDAATYHRSCICYVLNTEGEGVKLAEKNSTAPVLLLEKLTKWTLSNHAFFSIFGSQKQLRTDEAWIPLRAVVQKKQPQATTTADAIEKYQNWDTHSVQRDAEIVNPETLGRFIKRAILIGGPGMGKTTLLKRIARRYSEDNIPILHVRLITVAARMQGGHSFEEAVFDLGLDGSGIDTTSARKAAFPNWLLLCDGLDECGGLQEEVAAGVTRFASGHPDCRVLVTTRPVGYDAASFSDWRHYHIAALEHSMASIHLTKLVSEITQESSFPQKDIYALCSDELEKKETSKIVARSPLLLGLAASIIAHGDHLATTTERFFEQIFELIDKVPNSRVPEPPASSVLLQRFLDILGWHITIHPLSRIDETLKRCADELVRETEKTLLNAQIDAETCLNYWQQIGMIEKIGHDSEKTLVFIHKSFGEFAAARHLSSKTPDEQHAAITSIIDKQEWTEIIRFAAVLGLVDIVSNILLNSTEANESKGEKQISLAIELVATADPPPKHELRERIIGESIKFVSSQQRFGAYEVGESLVTAAHRFPKEVGQAATTLLNHEQPWTYLIGWATAVAAGPDYYRLDDLPKAMNKCINYAKPRRASLSGAVIVGSGEWGMVQSFILGATSVLLEQIPSNQTDTIVLDVLNDPKWDLTAFSERAQTLSRSKDRHDLVKKILNNNKEQNWSLSSSSDLKKYNTAIKKALFIACESIFNALDLPAEIEEKYQKDRALLHFSSFLAASKFDELLDLDAWIRNPHFDKAATQETLKGLIGTSGLDVEMLRSDAQRAKNYLLASPKNNIFEVITEVDPPAIDWALVQTLDLDIAKIEIALYHPSQWIIWLASHLLLNILSKSELQLMVRRILEKGEGYTLWAASGLVTGLKEDQAVELVISIC